MGAGRDSGAAALIGLTNTLLRVAVLAAKFFLALILARRLAPQEVGVYGLMVSTISVALPLIGFEVYQSTLRAISQSPPEAQVRYLRDQAVFHAGSLLLVVPMIVVAGWLGRLPEGVLPWFLVLLPMELVAQEASRALVSVGRSTAANAVLLARGGLWVYLWVLAVWMGVIPASLGSLWLFWLLGSGSSIAIGAYALRSLPWSALRGVPVNWPWLWSAVRVSARLALATAALVLLPASGRFMLHHGGWLEEVGFFTFYSSLASMVLTFVEAGVLSVQYPQYLRAYHTSGAAGAAPVARRLLRALAVVAVTLVIAGAILGWFFLPLVVGPEYTGQRGLLAVLLVAYGVLAVGAWPQAGLFARGRDQAILLAAVVGLGSTLVFQAVLIPQHQVNGAAWATLLGALVLLGTRWALLRRPGGDTNDR